LSAFKTLSLNNNFVESIQRSDITGTHTKTVARTLPDLVASMGQLERLLYLNQWIANAQLNIKYSAHRTDTIGQTLTLDDAFGADFRTMILKRFDTTLSFNRRSSKTDNTLLNEQTATSFHEDATAQTTFDIRKFRFTPKVMYTLDTATQGGSVQTQHDADLSPSLLVRADLSLPNGIKLPFMSKPFFFTNRIIWTNTLTLDIRSSPITEANNSTTLSYNTSADYELAKNLRMTLNGAFSRYWSKYIPQNDYVSYQLGTTFTFQF
jgi:hypothetical protein